MVSVSTINGGSRWNIVFDITPEHGQRFIMDGMPGLIHSADDFGIKAFDLGSHGRFVPATWTTGSVYNDGPFSAYASGF